MDEGEAASSSSTPSTPATRAVGCIVLGMAGAGKTTLMHALNAHLHANKQPYYLLNLDPAVLDTPYGANIDIRDTVNYKEVMRQYQLGPNGGILTALNLFATRFEEVMKLVEKRAPTVDYVLVDTPGQIEIFTWSASGSIIAESLASAIPTVIAYVVDTPRCANAVSFMSNMLYACSILYKAKLPLLLVFNKIDAHPHEKLHAWMSDLDAFQAELRKEQSYMGTLASSMALMLEEFYSSLNTVGVSALTGEGLGDFFDALGRAADEYDASYAVDLRARRKAREEAELARQSGDAAALAADLGQGRAGAEQHGVAGERLDGDEGDDDGDSGRGLSEMAADDFGGIDVETDRSEYESLSRYLKQKATVSGKGDGGAEGGASTSGGNS